MWLLLAVVACVHAVHVSRNDSNVVVTYMGHAEAVHPVPVPKSSTGKTGTLETGTNEEKSGVAVKSDTGFDSDYLEHNKFQSDPTEATEDVVFIPSGNQDGGGYAKSGRQPEREREVRVKDVVEKHTIGDIINDRIVRVETESPNEGILFISGKNNENMEQTIKKEEEVKRTFKEAKKVEEAASAPLDCKNLNCDQTQAGVCGVKVEQKRPKYRLFLNECYFRKVNCAFSYDYNRYAMAPREKCASVASHYSHRPGVAFPAFRPQPPPQVEQTRRQEPNPQETRKMMPSRRALSSGLDGAPCEHPCPTHCPEDYAPECALSVTATLSQVSRVFLNHCQLDLHSCATGSVWQRRPLSDCVGNKKAEVQNNRAFIGWMQRVGIVDSKGRMVLA